MPCRAHFGLTTLLATVTLTTFGLETATLRSHLERIEQRYGTVAALINLGPNDDGDSILGLRLSLTPTVTDPSKTGFFVIGGHHGNEPHSVALALHLAETLANRIAHPRITQHEFDDTEWWIIPAMNLPGLRAGSRWEHGRDPNREYPGPCFSAPENPLGSTHAVLAALEARPFVAAATLHGYIGSFTSPWGISTPTPRPQQFPLYEKWLRASTLHNGYRWGTSAEIIYPANGTFEDYVFWKKGLWSLLVELRSGSPKDIFSSTTALVEFFSLVNASRMPDSSTAVTCHMEALWDLYLE